MHDADRWFAGKTFSSDWSSRYLAVWAEHLAGWRDRDCRILEIGSWEGRSAVIFLSLLPRARITCIDPFTGSVEHHGYEALATLEQRFDANLSEFGDRVEKIASRSLPALDRLVQEGRRYDVIYVDGSHTRDDVLMDSVLSWQLLEDGGVLIWDDYLWGVADLPERDRPQPAVDAFLAMHPGEHVVLHRDLQVLVRKQPAEAADRGDAGWMYPRTLDNLVRFFRKQPLRAPRSRTRG